MTWKCCLWSFHSRLHPGMNLSADLFIVLFPSELHLSYLELLHTTMILSSPANWCNSFSWLHKKHFSTFIKTKCNSFSFTPRMIPCKIFLTKPCTFLLKQLPVLNGSTAQIYPVDYRTKINLSKISDHINNVTIFTMRCFIKSCPTDIDHPLNSPSPSMPWPQTEQYITALFPAVILLVLRSCPAVHSNHLQLFSRAAPTPGCHGNTLLIGWPGWTLCDCCCDTFYYLWGTSFPVRKVRNDLPNLPKICSQWCVLKIKHHWMCVYWVMCEGMAFLSSLSLFIRRA